MYLTRENWDIYDPFLEEEKNRIRKHNATCAKNRAKRKRKKKETNK
jgi:hypothetical protein